MSTTPWQPPSTNLPSLSAAPPLTAPQVGLPAAHAAPPGPNTLPARVQARREEQLTYEQELARRARVLEARLTGASPVDIAEQEGYSSVRAVQSIIDSELSRGLREPAEHLIHLELLRLDRLLKSLWQLAIGGWTDANGNTVPPDGDAVDRVLKVMERRARLLGLDKPEVIQRALVLIAQGSRRAPEVGTDTLNDHYAEILEALETSGALEAPAVDAEFEDTTPMVPLSATIPDWVSDVTAHGAPDTSPPATIDLEKLRQKIRFG